MNMKTDPTDRLHSLDMFYYFFSPPQYEVIQGHQLTGAKRGDILGSRWDSFDPIVDGHFRGTKDGKPITLPSYKVQAIVKRNEVKAFENVS